MFGINEKKIERWKQERNLPKLEKALKEAETYALRLKALEALGTLGGDDALVAIQHAFNDPVRAVAIAATDLAETRTQDAALLARIESLRKEWQTVDQNTVERQRAAEEKNEEDERTKLAKRAREIELKKIEMEGTRGTRKEQATTGFLSNMVNTVFKRRR